MGKKTLPLDIRIPIAFFFVFFLLPSCEEESNPAAIEAKIQKNIDFTSEVGPLLIKACSDCHRPGQAAPFSLLSYRDAKQNANKIKFVTRNRIMPPWPADRSYSHFLGERALTSNEIKMLSDWVDLGCPAGDTGRWKIPDFPHGSSLGQPDQIIHFKDPIPIPGNGTDHFYMVKVPFVLPFDTFIRFVEFVPQQRKLAHHVNGHLVNYKPGMKKDIFAGASYWLDLPGGSEKIYKEMGLSNDDGTFPPLIPNTVYYLPGFSPPRYPDGIGGWHVEKNAAFFLKNLHYGPSKSDCYDSSTLNIFYGAKPLRPIRETQLGTFGIAPIEPEFDIPADQVKKFSSRWTVPSPISILSVNPHMHLLGKSFLAYAVGMGGDTIPLIRINRWDFNWQYYYTFPHPLKIPAGYTIVAEGVYDNTRNNPANPFHPPRRLTARSDFLSMGTTEEMFQFIFTFLPYQVGDETISLEVKQKASR